MDELKWKWAYGPYLDPPEGQKESAIKAGYAKVYFKSEIDAKIESLKASHYAEMVDAGMRERRLRRAPCTRRVQTGRTPSFCGLDGLTSSIPKIGMKWNASAEPKRRSTNEKIIKKNNLRLCVQEGYCLA